MSPRRLGLLAALLAGVTLTFSALTHAASGRGRAALLSAVAGIAVVAVSAMALDRAAGRR